VLLTSFLGNQRRLYNEASGTNLSFNEIADIKGPDFRYGRGAQNIQSTREALEQPSRASDAQNISEFSNEINDLNDDRSAISKRRFDFTTSRGANISLLGSDFGHIQRDKHPLTMEQWNALFDNLENVEYAVGDNVRGSRSGMPVLVRAEVLFSQPNVYERVKNDIRYTQDGMTRNEAATILSGLEPVGDIAAAKETVRRDGEEALALFERYRTQFEASGPQAAEQYSVLLTSFLGNQRRLYNEASGTNLSLNEIADIKGPDFRYGRGAQNIQQALDVVNESGEVYFQPVNADVDLDARVPVVYLAGDLSALTKQELREKLRTKLKSLVDDGVMITRDAAGFIGIGSRKKRDHVLGSSQNTSRIRDIGTRNAKNLALNSIDELVKNSVLIESIPNTEADKVGVKAYHRFYVPIMTRGGRYTIRLVAEEYTNSDGLRPIDATLYDVVIKNKNKGTTVPTSPAASSETSISEIPFEITIREMLSGVNDAFDKPYVGAGGQVLEQPAYHGSPHRFDNFSTDHIGAGEGIQAFGWGLYFTGSRGIAEWYRNKLTEKVNASSRIYITQDTPSAFINGVEHGSTYYKGRSRFVDKDGNFNNDAAARAAYAELVFAYNNKAEAIVSLKANIDRLEAGLANNNGANSNPEVRDRMFEIIENTRRAISMIENNEVMIVDAPVSFSSVELSDLTEGQLFKVDVPESDTLLDYDKRMSEQPEAVRTAIDKLAAKHGIEYQNFSAGYIVMNGEKYIRADGIWKEETTGRPAPSAESTVMFEVITSNKSLSALINTKEALIEHYAQNPAALEHYTNELNILKAIEDTGTEARDLTGAEFYGMLSDNLGSDKAASLALNEAGIPGLQYLDGGSRGRGEGTHNFVIWNDQAINTIETYYQMAGEQALTADRLTLAGAEALEQNGMTNEEIRQETGWFRGMDGRWRFEIPDNLDGINFANMRNFEHSEGRIGTLGDIYHNPMLYRAYPQLEAMQVSMHDTKNRDGFFDRRYNVIAINLNINEARQKDALLHEIQHVIQDIEGFASGGSVESMNTLARRGVENMDARARYNNLAGEIEARDTSDRGMYGREQRRITRPDLRDDAIIVFNGAEVAYSMEQGNGLHYSEVLQRDAEAWSNIVDDIFAPNSTHQNRDTVRVMTTPLALHLTGANVLPVYASVGKLRTVNKPSNVSGGHGMTQDILKQLPAALADPVMIFESATNPNSRVVMTEIVDSNGSTVITPIHLEKEMLADGQIVNWLASVYDQATNQGVPRNQWFLDQINQGRLMYLDTEKGSRWLGVTGLQLPSNATIESLVQTIPTQTDLVNMRETYPRDARTGDGHYQSRAGTPRGSIEFRYEPVPDTRAAVGGVDINGQTRELRAVINIFENADKSTMLHEMAHFFFVSQQELAMMPGINSRVREDFDTLLDWLGVSLRYLTRWIGWAIRVRNPNLNELLAVPSFYIASSTVMSTAREYCYIKQYLTQLRHFFSILQRVLLLT